MRLERLRPAKLEQASAAQIAETVESHPAYDARRLVDQSGKAQILLDGQAYTLRITRQGKLLLTK